MSGCGDLAEIGRRIDGGQRLGPGDALALFRSGDLLALGELASLANRRKNGELYSVVMAHEASRRLLSIVNNLLDITRLGAGAFPHMTFSSKLM